MDRTLRVATGLGLAAALAIAPTALAQSHPGGAAGARTSAGLVPAAFAQGPVGDVIGAVLDALTPDEVRALPIDRRQAWLDQRIDRGVGDGSLTQAEARRLREDFGEIARLESAYRRDGVTRAEQAELDRRFDRLSSRVFAQRHDGQDRGWTAINQRQARLDDRIDAGVRDGSLNRREAERLRDRAQTLARLETRYRYGGLTQWERDDLDRRFDDLSKRVRSQRHDGHGRAGVSINARQAELERRIEAGVADGSLTGREAARLRDEYRDLARLEARYRRGALTARERADLDRRFDRLAHAVRTQRYDRQTRVD